MCSSDLRAKDEEEFVTRELSRCRLGIGHFSTHEVRQDAYRRGAEAMREACIGAACGFIMGYSCYYSSDGDKLEADLRALPLSEP